MATSGLLRKAQAAGVFDRKSALFSAPTGTGKSYVGLKILEHYLDSRPPHTVNVYLVPFRALANEMYEALHEACGDRYEVRIATGEYNDPIRFARTDLLVATYEKFLALLQARDDRDPFRPYAVVMDEFHLVGDPGRGPRVESLVARLEASDLDVLLYPLSAVVGNPDALADWLGVGEVRGDEKDRLVQVTYATPEVADKDAFITEKIEDLVPRDRQLLVFCNKRSACQTNAERQAAVVAPHLTADERAALDEAARHLEELSASKTLARLAGVIRQGCAFHHAGLEMEVRRTVEEQYRDGRIKVVFATPTLSSGVNLPAYAVIVRDAWRDEYVRQRRQQVWLKAGELLNMLGRAGRYKKAEHGYGWVLYGTSELKKLREGWKDRVADVRKRIAGRHPGPIHSQLGRFDHLLHFLLFAINDRGEASRLDLVDDLKRTFWSFDERVDLAAVLTDGRGGKPFEIDVREEMEEVLKRQIPRLDIPVLGIEFPQSGFVVTVGGSRGNTYEVTIEPDWRSCTCPHYRFRCRAEDTACKHIAYVVWHVLFHGGVEDPDQKRMALYICLENFGDDIDPANRVLQGLLLLEEWGFVTRTADGFARTELGRIVAASYLPLPLCHQAITRLQAAGDVDEDTLLGWAAADTARAREKDSDYHEILRAWIDEVPRDELEKRAGYYQALLALREEAGAWLDLYAAVAESAGRDELTARIHHLRRQVEYGAREELFPLLVLRIPHLARGRARELFDHGIHDVGALAEANPRTLSLRGTDLRTRVAIVDAARRIAPRVRKASENLAAAAELGGAASTRRELAERIGTEFRMNVADVAEWILPP